MNPVITKARALLRQTILLRLGWMGCAVALMVMFGVFHIIGWRHNMSFISGTVPGSHAHAMVIRGMLYGLSYFGAVILAPILILAAGIRAVLKRTSGSAKSKQTGKEDAAGHGSETSLTARAMILRPLLLLLILVVIVGYDYWCYRSAIGATLEWARLNPIPSEASDLTIETEGTMFTRQFVLTFSAPEPIIKAWLQSSPGTSTTTPEIRDGTIVHYSIRPGGGAQFAELKWSKPGNKITIRTYWS